MTHPTDRIINQLFANIFFLGTKENAKSGYCGKKNEKIFFLLKIDRDRETLQATPPDSGEKTMALTYLRKNLNIFLKYLKFHCLRKIEQK